MCKQSREFLLHPPCLFAYYFAHPATPPHHHHPAHVFSVCAETHTQGAGANQAVGAGPSQPPICQGDRISTETPHGQPTWDSTCQSPWVTCQPPWVTCQSPWDSTYQPAYGSSHHAVAPPTICVPQAARQCHESGQPRVGAQLCKSTAQASFHHGRYKEGMAGWVGGWVTAWMRWMEISLVACHAWWWWWMCVCVGVCACACVCLCVPVCVCVFLCMV